MKKTLMLIIFCVAFYSCENHVQQDEEPEIIDQDECNPDTSFANIIKPIIDNNCVRCHNGNQFPDLRTYQGVSANSGIVKEQVVNRTMPIGDVLSNDEINFIKCWVESGALNN
ncbi:hypothetical protein C7447_102611 [Tenacibaculum adriaticum]|uniref:Cytochrome c domain-containing protein n=1 Tax=Tenacibaculum adriaticum TaxID=413713 RepID=A0A5S5DXF1_9FLAO|nr:cytochrome c [Tenacibaculum adriaticum]TYP99289.1 hypothetical protein C7447_102611 [Tenacibaculum adriaticum]